MLTIIREDLTMSSGNLFNAQSGCEMTGLLLLLWRIQPSALLHQKRIQGAYAKATATACDEAEDKAQWPAFLNYKIDIITYNKEYYIFIYIRDDFFFLKN